MARNPSRNPYVGPRAFDESEQAFFFGRDQEIEILAGLVMARRAALFFAQSGAGKSSLVRAGLLPYLTRQETVGRRARRAGPLQKMRVLPVLTVGGGIPGDVTQPIANVYVFSALLRLRPNDEPVQLVSLSLTGALAPFFSPAPVTNPSMAQVAGQPDTTSHNRLFSPTRYDAAASPDTLLIFDQFEELFTYHPTHWQEREDFFQQVAAALAAYPSLHVLFTMREDYIAELTPYTHLLPEGLRPRFRLERLKRDAALLAIKAPAAQEGRPFEEGVAEDLVDNLRRRQVKQKHGPVTAARNGHAEALDEYVEPVHLQIVCRQLWDNLPSAQTHIRAEDVQVFGDVDQALTDFYESTVKKAVTATGLSERRLRTWFDDHLITPARTRGLVYRGEEETEGLPNEAVQILNDAWIIRADIRGGDTWYELTHDRLVEPILAANAAWLEHHQNPLALAAEAWLAAGRAEGKLYSGDQLKQAQAQVEAEPDEFSETEKAFVRAGVEAEQKQERRRQRWLLAGAVVLVLVLAGLSAWAINRSLVAQASERNAVAAQVEAEMLAQANAALAEEQSALAEQNATLAEEQTKLAEQNATLAEEARDQADLATEERLRAERQEQIAFANQLAAQSIVQLGADPHPQRSLLLAVEAMSRTLAIDGASTGSVESALRQALDASGGMPLGTGSYRAEQVHFSPDGDWLAVGVGGPVLQVWRTDELKQAPHRLEMIGEDVTALEVGDNGQALIGDAAGNVLRLDLNEMNTEPEQIATLPGAVAFLAVVRQGRSAVAVGGGQVVQIDLDDSSTPAVVLIEDEAEITALAISDDTELVAVGHEGAYVRLWAQRAGRSVLTERARFDVMGLSHLPHNRIARLQLSPDGTWMALVTDEGGLELWNLADDSLSGLFGSDGPYTDVAFLNGWLLAGSSEGLFRIRLSPVGERRELEQLHESEVAYLLSNPRMSWFAAVGPDRRVVLDNEGGRAPIALTGHESQIVALDSDRDGRWVAAVSANSRIRLWSVDGRSTFDAEPVPVAGDNGAIEAIGFSQNSSKVHAWSMPTRGGGGGGFARPIEAVSAAPHPQLPRSDELPIDWNWQNVQFSPDGNWAVALDQPGERLELLPLADGEATPVGLSAPAGVFAFDPGGRWLVGGGNDNSSALYGNERGSALYQRWDLSAPQAPPARLHGYQITPAVVAIDPSGRLVASAATNTVRVWDFTAPDAQPHLLRASQSPVQTMSFSPDGRWLVIAGDDGLVYLWNAVDWSQKPVVLEGHSGSVHALTFHAGQNRLITAGADRTVRLWSLADPSASPVILRAEGQVMALAVSPDGRWLVAAVDREMALWRMDPEALMRLACGVAGRPLTVQEWNQFVGQEAYQSTCPDLPEPAVAGYIRNRDLVETFLQAADLLEQDGWDLLQRADLLPILYHPDVVYSGPDLGNVANLSDVEKQVLAEILAQEREPIPFLWMHPELFTVPLAVPASAQISLHGEEAVSGIATFWNNYGTLLAALAHAADLDIDVLAAVVLAEAGGRRVGDDGRITIRFENQIFYREWGQYHEELFNQHFDFNRDGQSWTEHLWRPSQDAPWRGFHGNQDAEWEVFDFARSLNETAAMRSISMGSIQIMGFNHAYLGFETVQDMFHTLADPQAGIRSEFISLLDFVNSRELLLPLRRGDFYDFARGYNGSGQAEFYRGIMERYQEQFRNVRVAATTDASDGEVSPEAAQPSSSQEDPVTVAAELATPTPAPPVTPPPTSTAQTTPQEPMVEDEKVQPMLRKPFAGNYPISQRFGENPTFYGQFVYDGVPLQGHHGIDFAMPVGVSVLATDKGRVVETNQEDGYYGHWVKIEHAWGESLYTNLDEIRVTAGQSVALGETIATSGNSGASTGPHLGFHIRIHPYSRSDGWGGFSDPEPLFAEPLTGE